MYLRRAIRFACKSPRPSRRIFRETFKQAPPKLRRPKCRPATSVSTTTDDSGRGSIFRSFGGNSMWSLRGETVLNREKAAGWKPALRKKRSGSVVAGGAVDGDGVGGGGGRGRGGVERGFWGAAA